MAGPPTPGYPGYEIVLPHMSLGLVMPAKRSGSGHCLDGGFTRPQRYLHLSSLSSTLHLALALRAENGY
eukprot:6208820-Pleurochrysis_carterae.AAC.1